MKEQEPIANKAQIVEDLANEYVNKRDNALLKHHQTLILDILQIIQNKSIKNNNGSDDKFYPALLDIILFNKELQKTIKKNADEYITEPNDAFLEKHKNLISSMRQNINNRILISDKNNQQLNDALKHIVSYQKSIDNPNIDNTSKESPLIVRYPIARYVDKPTSTKKKSSKLLLEVMPDKNKRSFQKIFEEILETHYKTLNILAKKISGLVQYSGLTEKNKETRDKLWDLSANINLKVSFKNYKKLYNTTRELLEDSKVKDAFEIKSTWLYKCFASLTRPLSLMLGMIANKEEWKTTGFFSQKVKSYQLCKFRKQYQNMIQPSSEIPFNSW